MAFDLRPERDVDLRDGRFVATTAEPWLTLDTSPLAGLAGRLVTLTFRTSFWDEPVRPVFRFWCGDGCFVDRIGAGPVAGAGLWTGRLPNKVTRISVSPTNRLGSFDFRIESLRARSWLALLAQGFRRGPRAARTALLARVIGWGPESDANLTWATAYTPLRDYAAWNAARARPLDLGGIDRPRVDWASALPIHIIIVGDDRAGLQRTVESLGAQVFPRWIAMILGERVDPADPRIVAVSPQTASQLVAAQGDGGLTCVVEAGDVLMPGALAYVVEQAQRYPLCRLFYGDALVRRDGKPAMPVLQPGWSPRLFTAQSALETPVFARDLKSWPDAARRGFMCNEQLPVSFVARLTISTARPLRRILVETRTRRKTLIAPVAPVAGVASVTIIIPTCDHPALLRRAVASIRAKTSPGRVQITIVDNGSAMDETKALLAELSSAPDVQCLAHPGCFNFSRMCNVAAAAATGDVVVFLNDDTEVRSADWLDRLVGHAETAGIGAVGAKLTYPRGRLQHIGILVGMGESSGHFGARGAPTESGWAGRNDVLHEVSAVTGACLAVARHKFEAVGGFDAEHLPVELSDVDLCLKLNARGWQTVVDPHIHLMHAESASRGGAMFRRLDIHRLERAVFIERWRHVLRDDPAFHPGLSLYSWQAALG